MVGFGHPRLKTPTGQIVAPHEKSIARGLIGVYSHLIINHLEPETTMTITIEDTIHAPGTTQGRARGELLLALIAMKVGQSFAVPADKTDANVRNTFTRADGKFSLRKDDQGNRRVWRVA